MSNLLDPSVGSHLVKGLEQVKKPSFGGSSNEIWLEGKVLFIEYNIFKEKFRDKL
jgi:hypothetical protein